MTALPLTNLISQTSAKSFRFATIVAQFGDGYMQRATDGINQKQEGWNVVYDNLQTADRDTVQAFIDIVKMAGVIEWTAPGDSTEKKWVIDPQSVIGETAKAGDLFSINLTLKRVFDL